VKRRVLVTGGTGFVGACLARRLLREGCEVHLAVRAGHASWRIADLAGEIQTHVVDLTQPQPVRDLVRTIAPAWAFNLMAHGAYSSQTDPQEMVRTNLMATMSLLDACVAAHVEAFVQAGSSSEYGFKDHAPQEGEALQPNSAYAVTKAAATHYCQYVAKRDGYRAITLRLYSVYGPFEEPTRLIPTLIVRGLHGRWPPLVDPDTARDFVYVDDVCEAFIRAATAPGARPDSVYNVGSGTPTTLRQVVETARQVLHVEAEPAWGTMPRRSWDTSVWYSNPAAIKAELGWTAAVPFEAGFRRTAEWLTADPSRQQLYEARVGPQISG
jgi:dolichol-phosphate mannosyltransferase